MDDIDSLFLYSEAVGLTGDVLRSLISQPLMGPVPPLRVAGHGKHPGGYLDFIPQGVLCY